jgi:hypothetical protein
MFEDAGDVVCWLIAAVSFICVICQLPVFANPSDRDHQGANSKCLTSLLVLSRAFFWWHLPRTMSSVRMKASQYSIVGRNGTTFCASSRPGAGHPAPCPAMRDVHICGMAKDGPGWVRICRPVQALAIDHALRSVIIWIQREFRGVRWDGVSALPSRVSLSCLRPRSTTVASHETARVVLCE